MFLFGFWKLGTVVAMLAFCVISCSLRLHFELLGQLCCTFRTFSSIFPPISRTRYRHPLSTPPRCRYSAVRMGIQGLMKLIADYAPSAMKDHEIKSYFGECPAVRP